MTASPPRPAIRLNPDYRVDRGHLRDRARTRRRLSNLVVNGGSLYGGGVVEGGVINPGPDPVHERGRERQGLPLRRLAQRRKAVPKRPVPGTQDYKQIVVAVKLDTPGNQAAERGYVEVQSNFIDPTDNSATRSDAGRERSRHRAAVLPHRHALLGERDDDARRKSSATTCCTTRSGTCASGPKTGIDRRARRTRCCSAARRTRHPADERTRRSTTTRTTSTSSRRPTPTRGCRSAATTPTAVTTSRPGRPTPSPRSTAGSPTRSSRRTSR